MQSPACNRVTPLGDIVAIPLRGAWLGNRGILHRGTEIVALPPQPALDHLRAAAQDWRLPQWHPHHFTVLFFHDEAVALAAGHRPCALCRRAAYNGYRSAAWTAGTGEDAAAGDGSSTAACTASASTAAPTAAGCTSCRGASSRPAPSCSPTTARRWCDDDAIVPWTTAGYGAARSRPRTGPRRRDHAAVDAARACATATARRSAPVHGPLVGLRHPRRSGRVAEGARLLSGYGGSTSIAGSNPAFSAYLLRIAHRGYAAQGGENSLATIAAALALGCDMVEVDVRRRRDGVLVLAPRRRQPARCAPPRRRAAADRRDVGRRREPGREAERDRPGDRRRPCARPACSAARPAPAAAGRGWRGSATAEPGIRIGLTMPASRIDAAADHPDGSASRSRACRWRTAIPGADASSTAPIS